MRRRSIVAFAVFACYLAVSVQPAAAAHTAIVASSHTTASDLSNGSLSNAEVERDGSLGYVGHDQYHSSAIARWAFDEGAGSTAEDHVQNEDGSISGASWTAGYRGHALNFTGGEHIVKGPSVVSGGGSAPPRTHTLSVWVNPDQFGDGNSNSGTIVMRDAVDTLSIEATSSGDWQFRVHDDSTGTSYTRTSSQSTSTTGWTHLAITYDGSTMYGYVNGELVATRSPGITFDSNESRLVVGDDPSVTGHDFEGIVDEVRQSTEALSPGLVGRLESYSTAKLSPQATERWAFDAGQGATAFGDNGTDGTLTNASWTSGRDGSAMSFQQTTDSRVGVPDANALDPDSITLSMWVNLNQTAPSDYLGVASRDISSSWGVLQNTGDPYLNWYVTANGTRTRLKKASGTLSPGTWEHVVVVYDSSSGEMSGYHNGTKVASTTHSEGAQPIDDSAKDLLFGDSHSYGSFHGEIEEVRLYSSVLSGSEIQNLYESSSGQLPETSSYTSPSHSATNTVEGWTNLDLSNASATVTWEGYDGTSWTTLNQTTYTAAGNHSATWGEFAGDEVRVRVDVEETGPGGTAQLHDEGVYANTYEPTIDDSSLSPNSTDTSTGDSVTLSADISDPDFSTAQGDSASIEWYVDGELRGTTSTTSSGTVEYTLSDVAAGEHDWHVEVEDSQGHRDVSATASFATPAELKIYNESAPTTLVDNATVELRMFTNETGDVQVYERTTSDGTINMSGLPVDKPFIVVADADGYYDRRIFVRSLYETQSIYMLPDGEQVSDTIFSIDDYTGQYASEDTVLLVQRPLNGSYRTVLGDYFGSTGEFPAELAYNTRHRLVLYNVQTGDQRIAGTYTPLTSSTQTVVVTPEGVTNIEGESPNVALQPQVRRLPALDGADISVMLREGNLTVTDWTVTATLENNSSSTTVWTATGNGPGTLSQTLDLDGSHKSTLVVTVTWNTSEGLSATDTFRISLTEAIGNDHSLLDGLTSLAALSPEGGARAAFTGFLAMFITVLVIAGVGSVQPSGEIAGFAGILTLTGFAVIGFGVTYDVVFVAAVGWMSFAAIRRGF